MTMRYILRILLVILYGALGAEEGAAQQPPMGEGILYVTNWPEAIRGGVPAENEKWTDEAGEPLARADLLPFVDTLALGYRYVVRDGAPHLSFVLSWTPGDEGLLDGERVRYDVFPEQLEMTEIEVHAAVEVEGRHVAELFVAADSMALAPAPDAYPFETYTLDWDAVFADAPADSARSYFERGFVLRDLQIVRVAFASYEAEAAEQKAQRQERPGPPVVHRRTPTRHAVFVPRIAIRIGWRVGQSGYYVPPNPSAEEGEERVVRPRRDPRTAGRTADRTASRSGTPRTTSGGRTRTGADAPGAEDADDQKAADEPRSRRKRARDDDDEEDGPSLVPAALVGAAAIGTAAVIGGTVGYYGHAADAPIGLAAGFVRPRGGVLLQVGINEAVLELNEEPQRGVVKITGFYDLWGGPVQPALGAGLWARERGHTIDLEPGVSLGAVGRVRALLVYGGYDLVTEGFELGVAYNFRHKRGRE